MKVYERVYIGICIVFSIVAAALGYLGYKYSRLPEMMIVIGCLFLFITIMYLFQIWTKVAEQDTQTAYAGRQFVKVKCLCKFQKKTFQSDLILCKNGILMIAPDIDYEVMHYDLMTVEHLSKYVLQLTYDGDKMSYVYQLTMNSPLEIKAILQMLNQQHVNVISQ